MLFGDDCDRGFLTKDELVKKYPGSIEELVRLAASVAHVPGKPIDPSKKKRRPTFIKWTNSAGRRGQRGSGGII
jgi:hypothetical protein